MTPFCLLPVRFLRNPASFRGFGLAFGLLFCSLVSASHFEVPPKIDGVVDETEWAKAITGDGAFESETGATAPEGMRFWLGYDKTYVYFAARLEDSQPGTIIDTENRTNVSLSGNDQVTLFLDAVGNLTNFNAFSMNPRGATSIRIAGGRAAKTEWLGEIQSEGRRTETGWEVEARIPWQIMRLPGAGARTLRFNIERYMPRYQREFVHRYTGGNQNENFGSWEGVELPAPRNERALQILPYAYLGGGDTKPIFNSGADFRYQVSDRIESVGTLNPDFRNIENDILSLDFSYFERLAGDSRPFFQEGGNYFMTGYDNKLFVPQRIGSLDTGIKVFGKPDDKTQFGVMNLATFGKENATVASAAYYPDSRTNVNFAATSLRREGISNDGVFLNYGTQIGRGSVYAITQQTFDEDRGQGGMYSLGGFYEDRGLNTWFDVTALDRKFAPRLGFAREVDAKVLSGGFSKQQIYETGAIMETEYSINGNYATRWNGDQYRRSVSGSVSITDRKGLDIDFGGSVSRFEENDDFRLNLSIEKPRGDRYRRWEIGGSLGRLRGERFVSYEGSLSFRPIENLQVNVGAEFVRHFRDERLIILSANYDLTKALSVSGRAVQNGDDTNAYVSLRRTGVRGMEYFLIVGDPNSRSFRSTVILKVVTPFDIAF